MTTIYKMIGLTMKVEKHIRKENYNKAAMYFAARAFRDGKPEEGSAEYAQMEVLKEQGYKFFRAPSGDVVAEKPSYEHGHGRYYSGREVLRDWEAL